MNTKNKAILEDFAFIAESSLNILDQKIRLHHLKLIDTLFEIQKNYEGRSNISSSDSEFVNIKHIEFIDKLDKLSNAYMLNAKNLLQVMYNEYANISNSKIHYA